MRTQLLVIPIPVPMACQCGWDLFVGKAVIVVTGICLLVSAIAALFGCGWLVGKVVTTGYRVGRLPRAWAREIKQ